MDISMQMHYYDDQVIEVPKGMCMRQVGIYKYQTRMKIDKTVPIVKLMSKYCITLGVSQGLYFIVD